MIMETNNRFELIREWARERGLYDAGDVKTQYVKLGEEFGELGKSIINKNAEEFEDAIGDMIVVLTNLAHLGGAKVEDCIDSAYNVIKKRKGKMVNGSFIKEENDSTTIVTAETGNVFRCLNTDENLCRGWSSYFNAGILYKEVSDGSKTPEGTIYLKNNEGYLFFVDIASFKLEGTIIVERDTFDANA